MRSKDELNAIALDWAESTLEVWQNEYGSWDGITEDEELTEDELEYLMYEAKFIVKVKK